MKDLQNREHPLRRRQHHGVMHQLTLWFLRRRSTASAAVCGTTGQSHAATQNGAEAVS